MAAESQFEEMRGWDIRKFSIFGLLGEKDIHIVFDSPVNIFIADNGIGKTTILSIIYSVLSRQLHRLRKFEFSSILIEFTDGKKLEIPSKIIQPEIEVAMLEPRLRRYLHRMPEGYLYHLFDAVRGATLQEFRRNPLVEEMAEIAGVPPAYLFDILRDHYKDVQLEFGEGVASHDKIRETLAKRFPYKILYFPTYRRIEEELENLGYERKDGVRSEALIQFGMADVIGRIKRITDQIKNSSVEWYSRINGRMLSQLVDGITVDSAAKESIKDKEALKIVLDRIGGNIGGEQKNRIMKLVESGDIAAGNYETLAYFLSNLIKIYDQQKELDNSIKDFVQVCNKYLVDKQIVYNESSVEIGIYQKVNGKVVDVAKLSSGEKQIISLFSKLHLEKREDLALLFDEPELSLSIEWQRMLLPDIFRSGRCRFLLATTHSPFIFENEFDGNARDLTKYIRRVM